MQDDEGNILTELDPKFAVFTLEGAENFEL